MLNVYRARKAWPCSTTGSPILIRSHQTCCSLDQDSHVTAPLCRLSRIRAVLFYTPDTVVNLVRILTPCLIIRALLSLGRFC